MAVEMEFVLDRIPSLLMNFNTVGHSAKKPYEIRPLAGCLRSIVSGSVRTCCSDIPFKPLFKNRV